MEKLYDIGDVVLVNNYIFEKGTTPKNHYFIIVNVIEQNNQRQYLGFSISSNETYKYDRKRLPVSYNEQTRLALSKQSYVNCSHLFNINPKDIIYCKKDKVSIEEYIKFLSYYINKFKPYDVNKFNIKHFLTPVYNEKKKTYIFLKKLDGVLYYRSDLKNKLQSQLDKIDYLSKKESDETKKIIESLLYDNIDNYFSIGNENIHNLLGKEIKKIPEIKTYFNILRNVVFTKTLEEKYICLYPNLTYLEAMDMLNRFLTNLFSLDKNNLNVHQKALIAMQQMNYPLKREIAKSQFIFLPNGQKNIIIPRLLGTIEDFPELVMLYGCCYQNIINPQTFSSSNNIFSKIIGIFFKLISYDYLEENNYCRYGDVFSINNYNEIIQDSICYLKKFKLLYLWKSLDCNNIKEPIPKLLDEISKIYKGDLTVNENDIKKFILTRPKNDLIDIISYIFAIELYIIYQKDPNSIFEIITEISKINRHINVDRYFEKIANLGLIPSKNFANYKNHIIVPNTKL